MYMKCVMNGSGFVLLCIWRSNFSSAILEGCHFPTALPLHLCQKSIIQTNGLFLESLFLHMDLITCFYTKSHHLDYSIFILNLEIRQNKSSNSVLLQSCFGYFGSTAFLYKLNVLNAIRESIIFLASISNCC